MSKAVAGEGDRAEAGMCLQAVTRCPVARWLVVVSPGLTTAAKVGHWGEDAEGVYQARKLCIHFFFNHFAAE